MSPSTDGPALTFLRQRAEDRRAAAAARSAATATLKDAILSARQAGMDTADIVGIVSVQHTKPLAGLARAAISRQGVYQLLDREDDRRQAAWEAAGKPTVEDAAATLTAAVPPRIEAVSKYEHAVSELASAMWQAKRNHGASAAADASGLAPTAAYEYLALEAPVSALNAAVAATNAEFAEELAVAYGRHRGLRLEARNVGSTSRDGQIDYDTVRSVLEAELAERGLAMPHPADEVWVSVTH